jgi:hypothetical protein
MTDRTRTGFSGADPGFQVRGGVYLKKLRRAQGGAKFFGVFCVKNQDFTPKNHIFSNCGGRRENFWGILSENSRFYTKKKIDIFSNFRGGGGGGGGGGSAGCAPWIRPWF